MCNGIIFSFLKIKINDCGFENINPRHLDRMFLHSFAFSASKVFFVAFLMCIWNKSLLTNKNLIIQQKSDTPNHILGDCSLTTFARSDFWECKYSRCFIWYVHHQLKTDGIFAFNCYYILENIIWAKALNIIAFSIYLNKNGGGSETFLTICFYL